MKSLSLFLLALFLSLPRAAVAEGSEGAGGGPSWLIDLYEDARPCIKAKLCDPEWDVALRDRIKATLATSTVLESTDFRQTSCLSLRVGRLLLISVRKDRCNAAQLLPDGFAESILELIVSHELSK